MPQETQFKSLKSYIAELVSSLDYMDFSPPLTYDKNAQVFEKIKNFFSNENAYWNFLGSDTINNTERLFRTKFKSFGEAEVITCFRFLPDKMMLSFTTAVKMQNGEADIEEFEISLKESWKDHNYFYKELTKALEKALAHT